MSQEQAVYTASITAPVNIATLKYWGKRDTKLNLPTNSSISVTLDQNHLRTLTTVATSQKYVASKLLLNGKEDSLNKPRLIAVLLTLKNLRKELELKDPSLPKFSEWNLLINSSNNFPTAAGLASSAAGLAAFVCAIAKLYELPQSASEISKIARQGSGSACRSLFGGFVAWEMGEQDDGSDSKAVEVAAKLHWPGIKAAILVVSDVKKDTSSTSGMQITVNTSDLFQERIKEVVPKRFIEMKEAILRKDFPKFAELTMKDSNSFHAVCLDSYPPIFYLNDTSRKIIKLVNTINENAGSLIAAYTFDAGPNAVIYYEEENEEQILSVLKTFFGDLEGWEEDLKNSLKDSVLGTDIFEKSDFSVSRLILTNIGDGPQDTSESLIDEKGEPIFIN